MRRIGKKHPPEETLERFALAALAQAEAEEIENHLASCRSCSIRLKEIEDFIVAFRSVAVQIEGQLSARKRRWPTWLPWPDLAALAHWKTTTAVVILLTTAILATVDRGTQEEAQFHLVAWRGANDLQIPRATKRYGFELDANGLGDEAYLEVVNEIGATMWRDLSAKSGSDLRLSCPALPPGAYYVRVYPLVKGAPDRIHLRPEYQFDVR